MTKANARKGGLWMLTIVGMILLVSLISLVTSLGTDGTRSLAAIVRFILGAALLYFMYRGFAWARWIVALLCAVTGVLAFLVANSLAQTNSPVSALILTATLSLVYLVSAVILLFSPSIRAFQRYQKGNATLDLP